MKSRPASTWADWCQVIIQSIVVGGAIYALCIYQGQLREMRRSNDFLKISTDAATEAAKAASKSLEMSRLDQRAWVSANGIIGGIPDDNKEFDQDVRVSVRNSGKTFAKQAKAIGHIRTRPAGESPNFVDDPSIRPTSINLLAPNGDYSLQSGSKNRPKVPATMTHKYYTGDLVLFVFGTITYEDIFRCTHWTQFCYIFDPSTKTYTAYAEHNDAGDDPCP